MRQIGILYWITGLSGAGKTTIGNRLYYELRKSRENVVLLDGDILKRIVSDHLEYSSEARKKRAMKYAMLCKMLTDQGMTVICCTIAMNDEVREWNRKNNKGYVEVFLDVSMDVLKKRDQKGMYSKFEKGQFQNIIGVDMDVEFPRHPDITLKNDGRYTVKECVDKILEFEVLPSSDFNRDTSYWNAYYKSMPDIENPSLFALEIGRQLKKDATILDLGCGNGRDSKYFYQLGLNVTGIDASDEVITMLQKDQNENMCFICDDFVTSSMVYAGQYDYCYSRFSLHAITEEQENELLSNIYGVLREGGKFFIEARSINDEIYGLGERVGKNAYFYEGHFRRFIKRKELEEKLLNVGFQIEYSKEERGYAPFKNMNPLVIRIIAKK